MNSANDTAGTDVRQKILASGRRTMGGKGFSAVGLNEVLTAAGVPKGSFYHYFGSKEAFGEALLQDYFDEYLAEMDQIFRSPGQSEAEQLDRYFAAWMQNQSFEDCQGKCLAVKLGAEVADLSPAMRAALRSGTAGIIERMARAIDGGKADGSLACAGDATAIAQGLYQLWLGASIMVKIVRGPQPLENALGITRQILHPSR